MALHTINSLLFKSNTFSNEQQTQKAPPDYPIDRPKRCGGYCIRAESLLINEKTNEVDTIIKGYDTTMDIVDRVDKVCKQKENNKDGFQCIGPEVCFIRQHNSCDGHIMIFQGDKNWLIPPTA